MEIFSELRNRLMERLDSMWESTDEEVMELIDSLITYMTVGLITPNEGRIFLDDLEITKYPVYKRAQRCV